MNRAGRDQWDEKAAFWDRLHGDAGNGFSRGIVEPAVKRLLDPRPGERVVEAACGNGTITRRLASWGADVTAFDFSRTLLELAEARGSGDGGSIRYLWADATDEAAVAALGEGTFDAAVCTMALMDMPLITPLFRGLRRLLRPGGRFVFVTSHPVFDTPSPVRITEEVDEDGRISRRHAMRIDRYLDVAPTRAVGARREPTPHNYYHRPLHQLLGEAFAAGFVMDALEEPSFSRPDDDEAVLEKDEFWQFPPALAGRLLTPSTPPTATPRA